MKTKVLFWKLRQLVPKKYSLHYRSIVDNRLHHVQWWAWFGIFFCEDHKVIKGYKP